MINDCQSTAILSLRTYALYECRRSVLFFLMFINIVREPFPYLSSVLVIHSSVYLIQGGTIAQIVIVTIRVPAAIGW